MKKFIRYFLLIILILVFTGCSTAVEDNVPSVTEIYPQETSPTEASEAVEPSPVPTASTESSSGSIMPPTDITFAVFRDDILTTGDADEYVTSWQLVMQLRFNVNIRVYDLMSYGKYWSDTDGEINLIADSDENIFAQIKRLSEKGVIVPFNEYLSDSVSWGEFPEGFRNTYEDNEGNIWAVPKGESISVFARAYNRDWMEKLNLGLPGNVNELYEVMNAFANSDPDNNGIADTYGTAITKRSDSMMTFKDVFEANGCRLTYSYETAYRGGTKYVSYKAVPIGYDPFRNIIADYSASEGMRNSLDFIKGLIDNGIARLDSNKFANGYFESEEYGTQYGLLTDGLMNTGTYDYTFSLDDTGAVKTTSAASADNEGYFIFSGTMDKEKVVPFFIDTFYGTLDGYKFAYAGLTGDYRRYDEENNVFSVNEMYYDVASHIGLLGELPWFNLDIRRPMLDENIKAVSVDDVLDSKGMFVLEPRHMSFLENMTAVPTDGSGSVIKYEKAILRAFTAFYEGEIGTEDLMDRFREINAVYDVDSLIESTNEKWLSGN